MIRAAHLAGRAINTTRTTAAHAISYTLTSRFGVPHGLAAALTLGSLFVHNAAVADDDAADPRGAGHVRETMRELTSLLGRSTPAGAREFLETFMTGLGLETRLHTLGIRGDDDIALIAVQADADRLSNNPRKLTQAAVRSLLQSVA
jgi:alcohol dehydrogenase class IV